MKSSLIGLLYNVRLCARSPRSPRSQGRKVARFVFIFCARDERVCVGRGARPAILVKTVPRSVVTTGVGLYWPDGRYARFGIRNVALFRGGSGCVLSKEQAGWIKVGQWMRHVGILGFVISWKKG